MHFLGCQNLARVDLPGVQDLAPQRHDRLGIAIARLLGRAARRVALDEENLAELRFLRGAIGQLAGQRRARNDFLANDFLGRLQTLLRLADRQLRNLIAGFRMLVEPQRETVLDDAGDERGRFTR